MNPNQLNDWSISTSGYIKLGKPENTLNNIGDSGRRFPNNGKPSERSRTKRTTKLLSKCFRCGNAEIHSAKNKNMEKCGAYNK